jgi:hypothetical protein
MGLTVVYRGTDKKLPSDSPAPPILQVAHQWRVTFPGSKDHNTAVHCGVAYGCGMQMLPDFTSEEPDGLDLHEGSLHVLKHGHDSVTATLPAVGHLHEPAGY